LDIGDPDVFGVFVAVQLGASLVSFVVVSLVAVFSVLNEFLLLRVS
jgi:hypothetical protein